MPAGLVRSGDFRNGTPIVLPYQFGTPVSSPAQEPFGNVEPQSNVTLDSNPVAWLISPAHFGNQVAFSLQTVPPIVVIAPGATGTTDINLTNLLATNSAALTYFGAPTGVTVTFAPSTDTSTSVATITVGAGVPAGKYTITVVGTEAVPNIENTQIHLVVAAGTTPPPPSGIALVAHATGASPSLGNPATTPGIDTTGANFIAIFAQVDFVDGTLAVSDSNDNAWTPLSSTGTGQSGQLFVSFNPVVGPGHTFQATNSDMAGTIYVEAFSGVGSGSPESGTDLASASSTASPQPGQSVSTLSVGDLTIQAISAFGFALPITIDSGFTLTDDNQMTVEFSTGGAMAYLIATGTSAVTPNWTFASAPTVAGSINSAAFPV